MSRIVAAILLSLSLVLLLRPAHATDFGEVIDWCSRPDDARLCNAYISAGLELLKSADPVSNAGYKLCPPKDTGVNTVVPILASWLEHHPDARPQPPLSTMGAALAERYPCP